MFHTTTTSIYFVHFSDNCTWSPTPDIYSFLGLLRGIVAATKYMLAYGVFHASVTKLVTQAIWHYWEPMWATRFIT